MRLKNQFDEEVAYGRNLNRYSFTNRSNMSAIRETNSVTGQDVPSSSLSKRPQFIRRQLVSKLKEDLFAQLGGVIADRLQQRQQGTALLEHYDKF